MDLHRNVFKRAIAQGKLQIGLWSSLCSNISAELLSYSGFDWLLLDAEHSPNDIQSLFSQLQAVAKGTATPIVRPPWNDPVMVKRVLDIGAQSLLVPYVCSAEEAKAAVAATRYAPAGVRGVAGTTRATRFGRVKDYAKRAHEELCVLVQVETKPALDQLEAICAVDGVDGVFIGPADLHASMGHPGETANPAILPLIEDAMRRIRKTGKAAGFLSPVEADAKRMIAAGCNFCAVGADVGLLARGAEALHAKFN
jgi:4-hydroxy-2-oxoheptanedioate aldolase